MMLHAIYCFELPLPCPFSGHPEFPCKLEIRMEPGKGKGSRALSVALRKHFEEKCEHKVVCPETHEGMRLCEMRNHLLSLRQKLDVQGILCYEIAEFMQPHRVPHTGNIANELAFRVGDYNPAFLDKSWAQIMEMLFPPSVPDVYPHKLSPFQQKRYFPHRQTPSF